MFSPARWRARTTPYIPTAKAGGFTAIPGKKFSKYPTREEIQEFSFRLRDQVKVKVQAEVPYRWQKELDDLARELNVKKLELYRYMIGEFLEKVKRKKVA